MVVEVLGIAGSWSLSRGEEERRGEGRGGRNAENEQRAWEEEVLESCELERRKGCRHAIYLNPHFATPM